MPSTSFQARKAQAVRHPNLFAGDGCGEAAGTSCWVWPPEAARAPSSADGSDAGLTARVRKAGKVSTALVLAMLLWRHCCAASRLVKLSALRDSPDPSFCTAQAVAHFAGQGSSPGPSCWPSINNFLLLRLASHLAVVTSWRLQALHPLLPAEVLLQCPGGLEG